MIIQIIALWTEWSIPVTNHKSFNWFSVLWLCVFSHRKVQSFLFLKDRNKDAELLQNAWLFNPRVVWASISVNESFRLLNSVGGGSGVLAADVQNKPFCGGMGDSGEYLMIHMVTTKSFATRGWMVAVSGGIRIAVSIPLKTNEGRVRAYYHLIQPSHLSSYGARLLIREEISGKSTYDRQ